MAESNRYRKLLKKENLRSTNHRQSILEALEGFGEPVSAERLYLALKDKGISISLSTVYRALDVLVEKNIISKTDFTDNNRSLYEIRQEGHKHHLVCIRCRKIIPVTGCPFHDYASRLEEQFDFSITGHRLELFGYCRDCSVDGNGRSDRQA